MTVKEKVKPGVQATLQSEIRILGNKIHLFETVLMNRDHPVLAPFVDQLKIKLADIDLDLNDYENKSELQLKLLLGEKLLVKSLIAFDDMEDALPRMKSSLEFRQKELERGKQA